MNPILHRKRAYPLLVLAAALCLASISQQAFAAGRSPQGPAAELLDQVIERLGGADRLSSVVRVRFQLLTQWQRMQFVERPYGDRPSYELHTDLRDYGISGWRNVRRFAAGAAWREITDLVRDSVAVRRSAGGPGGLASPGVTPAGSWAPLNIAYVDERDELFAIAPERLLLGLRAASDLEPEPDTVIGRVAHARLRGTVRGRPMTLMVRRTDGLPAMTRYLAAAPNDFGLAPWGEMEVEVWYSAWRRLPDGMVYPHQWDIRRVGRPYKRITVLAAEINPPAEPDSFLVPDSLRAAYLATARRPMHDLPLDSARLVDEHLAWFGTPGAPAGALRFGSEWILLEGGQAPLNAERATGWLERNAPGTRVSSVIVSVPAGGVSWLAGRGVRIHVAPGAVAGLAAVMRGHGRVASGVSPADQGAWLRVGDDSVRIEPVDLPDAPGSLLLYAPSRAWAYSPAASDPLVRGIIAERIRERGWSVTRLGSARSPEIPLEQ